MVFPNPVLVAWERVLLCFIDGFGLNYVPIYLAPLWICAFCLFASAELCLHLRLLGVIFDVAVSFSLGNEYNCSFRFFSADIVYSFVLTLNHTRSLYPVLTEL